jgi:hypothetical protein
LHKNREKNNKRLSKQKIYWSFPTMKCWVCV